MPDTLWIWRTGRKVGRTVYAQVRDSGPSDSDVLIGMMDTPELAEAAVRGHNMELLNDARINVNEFRRARGSGRGEVLMEIDPVTRFVVRCTVEGCTWQQEHKTHGNAEMDGARHEAEWHRAGRT